MRLITWNIQWGRGVDGRVDLARIAAVARGTADFDVLCLQEVAVNFPGLPGSSGENQVKLLQGLLPGYQACYAIGTDLPDDHGGRSLFGNLILSRLPLLQVFRPLLPWPADATVPSMQRVLAEAGVQAPWGPLRVMTTHLEYYSAMQRRAQVESLRARHAESCAHAREPRPDQGVDQPFAALPRPASAVLCGDCNFEPQDAEHARITAPFTEGIPSFCDAWLAAHNGAPHAHTVGLHGAEWPDRPYCCDFIFITEDLLPRLVEVKVNQDTDASDHQPVLLELAD